MGSEGLLSEFPDVWTGAQSVGHGWLGFHVCARQMSPVVDWYTCQVLGDCNCPWGGTSTSQTCQIPLVKLRVVKLRVKDCRGPHSTVAQNTAKPQCHQRPQVVLLWQMLHWQRTTGEWELAQKFWNWCRHTRQAGVDKRSLLIVNLFVDLCPIYLPLSWLDSYQILYQDNWIVCGPPPYVSEKFK